jgi:hypothetical protein
MHRLLVTSNTVPSSLILVTLMIEGIGSSKTLVLTRVTWHNILGDSILHSHRQENLKCNKVVTLYLVLCIPNSHTHYHIAVATFTSTLSRLPHPTKVRQPVARYDKTKYFSSSTNNFFLFHQMPLLQFSRYTNINSYISHDILQNTRGLPKVVGLIGKPNSRVAGSASVIKVLQQKFTAKNCYKFVSPLTTLT